MRNVKMTALIGDSFKRTVEILFKPFSAKKWAGLLLIALLAGMLFGGNGTGGGGSGNQQSKDKKETSVSAEKEKAQVSQADAAVAAPGKTAQSPEAARKVATTIAVIAIGVTAFFVGLVVFMTWIGARFKFVWLNAVINNTAAVIEPYSRHRREANSFFRMSILLVVIFITAVVVIVGGAFYGMAANGALQDGFKWTPEAAFRIFLAPALVGIIFLLSFIIFAFLADHFVVPIMAFDGCGVLEALKKLGGILRANLRDFALFTLIFFLLSVFTGTVGGFLVLFAVIAMFLVGAVIFGLPFLLLWVMLKAKLVFIIYAAAASIPFIPVTVMVILAMSLPFAVFFRVFSLKYLLSLGAGYGPETIANYSAKKADRLAGRAPVVISVMLVLFITLVITAGLLAAIAIPNFVRARDEAAKKRTPAAQAAAAVPAVTVPAPEPVPAPAPAQDEAKPEPK